MSADFPGTDTSMKSDGLNYYYRPKPSLSEKQCSQVPSLWVKCPTI